VTVGTLIVLGLSIAGHGTSIVSFLYRLIWAQDNFGDSNWEREGLAEGGFFEARELAEKRTRAARLPPIMLGAIIDKETAAMLSWTPTGISANYESRYLEEICARFWGESPR
jgi:hypothetical protein